ncbi:hypothetical protein CBP31_11730 [Oceanisphaera profunda]|uniref:DUF2956 domain-containing protein n=1 Tax=Oceanisphaera profunda TaxID=1416627 RepID=A0A1Y0D6P6_9GAMM|nr:DUF2956 domain-containing protein [Oceanisphaera profunda]ART83200.1 hypothetical protein CBP31_11730 [Oceanisphaera profunda]
MKQPKRTKTRPSPETVEEAERVAKATQKPGQTKEQTRLIAQGVQKGIDEYKKQQKARARAADKAKKQRQRAESTELDTEYDFDDEPLATNTRGTWLPWALLVLSWIGFAVFYWKT